MASAGEDTARAAEVSSRDRAVVSAVAWLGAMKWAGQAVAWLATFLVARALTPADYGIVGSASLYLGLLVVLSEFGLGSAVVVLRDLTPAQLRQANTISVLVGTAGLIISIGLAPAIAWFFHSPAVAGVVVALSTTFVISSFRTVPWAVLQRDLRFRRIAVVEGGQQMALAVLSVAMAFAGFRYWTLVVATILSTLVPTIFALRYHAVGFSRPRWEDMRRVVTFSRDIIAQRIAWYTYSNSDFLVAGRVLGERALGGYTVGWTIANAPIDKIGNVVLAVAPSVLSSIRDDPRETRRYVSGLTEAVAGLTFPLFIGLAVVAGDFVPLVLGQQWVGIVLTLRLLCAYACFRVLLPLLAQVLVVHGEERFAARNMLLGAIIMPVTFLVASRWGIAGIALGWILVHPVIASRLCARAFATLGMTAREFFFRPLWPALSASAAMTAAVLATGWILRRGAAGWPVLAGEVAAGAVAYGAALLLGHRPRIQALITMMRLLRGGSAAGA